MKKMKQQVNKAMKQPSTALTIGLAIVVIVLTKLNAPYEAYLVIAGLGGISCHASRRSSNPAD